MQAAPTQAVGLAVLVASLLLAGGLQLPLLERWSGLVPWVLLWGLLAFAGCAVVADRLRPHPSTAALDERDAQPESGQSDEPLGVRDSRAAAPRCAPAPGHAHPAGGSCGLGQRAAAPRTRSRPRNRSRHRDRRLTGHRRDLVRLALRRPLQRRVRTPRTTAGRRSAARARTTREVGDKCTASQAGTRLRGGGVRRRRSRL